jgi:dihydrofolate reductase
MSHVVLYIAQSLDGFIAGPDDDISWLYRYNDVDYGYDEFYSRVGAIIQGRRAYDIEMRNGWENAHPVPTFVLSREPTQRKPLRSDVVFTSADIAQVLDDARRMTTKDVWIEGGANVAQQFLDRGLIDQIILSVVPVVLGDGIRLFGEAHERIELDLRAVRQFDKGLVQLEYARL